MATIEITGPKILIRGMVYIHKAPSLNSRLVPSNGRLVLSPSARAYKTELLLKLRTTKLWTKEYKEKRKPTTIQHVIENYSKKQVGQVSWEFEFYLRENQNRRDLSNLIKMTEDEILTFYGLDDRDVRTLKSTKLPANSDRKMEEIYYEIKFELEQHPVREV